jgi:hypothetical protein
LGGWEGACSWLVSWILVVVGPVDSHGPKAFIACDVTHVTSEIQSDEVWAKVDRKKTSKIHKNISNVFLNFIGASEHFWSD